MTEIEIVKKQLAEARLEIDDLNLRLRNLTLLYKMDMRAAGKIPRLDQISDAPKSGHYRRLA